MRRCGECRLEGGWWGVRRSSLWAPVTAVIRVIDGSWGGVIEAGSIGLVEVVEEVGEQGEAATCGWSLTLRWPEGSRWST